MKGLLNEDTHIQKSELMFELLLFIILINSSRKAIKIVCMHVCGSVCLCESVYTHTLIRFEFFWVFVPVTSICFNIYWKHDILSYFGSLFIQPQIPMDI